MFRILCTSNHLFINFNIIVIIHAILFHKFYLLTEIILHKFCQVDTVDLLFICFGILKYTSKYTYQLNIYSNISAREEN